MEKRCPICTTLRELGEQLTLEVARVLNRELERPARSQGLCGNIETALCLAFERGASLDEPEQWVPCDEHISLLEYVRKAGF